MSWKHGTKSKQKKSSPMQLQLRNYMSLVLCGTCLAVFAQCSDSESEPSAPQSTLKSSDGVDHQQPQHPAEGIPENKQLEEPLPGPTELSRDGWPVLVEAAYRGNQNEVIRLIELGADVNQEGPGKWTALMQAAGRGDLEIVKRLLDAGAMVNTENLSGNNAYDLAIQRGHDKVASWLIEHGAADEELRRFIGAAYRGDIRMLRRMLDAGMQINRQDYLGRSALFYALTGDDRKRYTRYYPYGFELYPNTAKFLLQAGADPNLQDHQGKHALLAFLTEYGQVEEIVALLLENGTRMDLVDDKGRTMLSHRIPPRYAKLVLEAGVDINKRDQRGKTPLHWQAEIFNTGMVEFLLSHGADPSIVDDHNKRPIDLLGINPGGSRAQYWQKTRDLLNGAGE